MENQFQYPPADLVINRAVRCASCNQPTSVRDYDRPSGTVKTNCKCEDGPHFQTIIPTTAGVGA
jgi:hypothetical protein